jgi:D-glycero-alpha-D-manno-heptose-7-phosphate kinase
MDRTTLAPVSTRITARAPLRISFAGGGTDIMPYAGRHGGCVLSATVDLFVYASIRRRPAGSGAPRRPSSATAAFDAARDVLGHPADPGIECATHVNGLSGSGLGTSSALIVAMLTALGGWYGRPLPGPELARLAYVVERERLGQLGGAQDQYAAAIGGINLIEFGADGSGTARPLDLPPGTVRRLERSLLLCDTGVRRDSAAVLRGQVARVEVRDAPSVEALHRMKALAVEMRDLLLAGHVAAFGELMGEAWRHKRTLLTGPDGTVPPTVRDAVRLIDAARGAGAVSGRLLGAGGGGFLSLFAPPDRRGAVADALIAAGGRPRRVSLCATGATTVHTGRELP